MKLLEGKVSIITGATRGIGKAIASKFAEQGSHIVFTYTSSDEKARELETELEAHGVKVRGYKSDAADFAAAGKLVDDAVKEFGTVDVLVNNAGITRDNLLLRITEEQWDEVIRVNLKSCFNLTKAVIRPMLKAKSGSIINMSSVVGVEGNSGQANYAASKAGMIGFTKTIAEELGSRNIRTNAIAPGFIVTEMTDKLDEKVIEDWYRKIPMKRGGTPQEVADAALFLASGMSTFVNGQVLQVCGGMSM